MKFEYSNERQAQLLIEHSIIEVHGVINYPMVIRLSETFDYLLIEGSPDITLTIASDGGDSIHALNLYAKLKHYDGHITGVVDDRCASAAVTILQACDKRIVYPSAQICVHHSHPERLHAGMFDSDNKINASGIEELSRMRHSQDQKIRILLDRMKIDQEGLLRLFDEDRMIFGEEAKKLGLVDEVFDPLAIPFKVKSED